MADGDVNHTSRSIDMKIWQGTLSAAITILAALVPVTGRAFAAESGEAQWIWGSPNPSKLAVCFFRREFTLEKPEAGSLEITSDGRYECFLNGVRVGEGSGWESMESIDLQPRMVRGRNVLAVKVMNDDGGAAGFVARLTVRNEGNTDVSHSTDGSWRFSATETPGWERTRFDDTAWTASFGLGELGVALPWGDKLRTAEGKASGRFTIPPEFRVERVVAPVDTGSLVAMTFNEYGEILAGREHGPVLLMSDSNRDGAPDTTEIFTDKVTDCQGLLALNGRVYAVGEGPNGIGFYVLRDNNGDRKADELKLLFRFRKGRSEHGPHAPVLGPDGRIYLMVGNLNSPEVRFKASSPYRSFYEGDLAPRRFDVSGNGAGDSAPGGVILRTDAEGTYVEVFCGGFRNCYDMAFNRRGDLFTVDSDTEPDVGLPWYRPTRMCLCIPGAEFGWRSGWGNWPAYFFDSLPPTIDCGRGSPTGVESYDHFRFPARYHGALFACDWSRGRILAIHAKPAGGRYTAEQETFLEGRPLNVTDLAVGPDGWLYFSTGGRGTEGGVYRIVALQPTAAPKVEPGVMQAIHQPQLQSAWARNAIAGVKEKMGAQWNQQITAMAADAARTPAERARALDLMSLVGPAHTPAGLVKSSADSSPEVRAKATTLLGQYGDAKSDARLGELLRDPDAGVRRRACEALVERNATFDLGTAAALLNDDDRFVRWAAGRLIERQPAEKWHSQVLDAKTQRAFLEGAMAVLRTTKTAASSTLVLLRCADWLKRPMSDPDFLDLLRVIEVALHRSGLKRAQVPELAALLNRKYPTTDATLNRELVRLLSYFQEPSLAARALTHIQSNAPLEDRLHTGLYSVFVAHQWKPAERKALLEFFETARHQTGGPNYESYIDTVTREFINVLSTAARREILDFAATAPSSATHALRAVGAAGTPDAPLVAKLIQLDDELAPRTREIPVMRFRTGITAILSASRRPEAMAHLRAQFEREPDRRQIIGMGLAEEPDGVNWPYLVRALAVAEGDPARYIVNKLSTAKQKPDSPEPLRQAILCGLRLGDQGGKLALPLLIHWTGQNVSGAEEPWNTALAKWQDWFRRKYPDQLDPSLPVDSAGPHWKYDELLELLVGANTPQGDARRGAAVFEKATCIKCHRYGQRGEGIGPDLSTVSQRFHRKEIVESVLYPSQVISDQYAAKTVQTKDGLTYTGIVAEQGADTIVVLDNQAKKNVIGKQDIETIAPAKQSAMPDGLFNSLTREEIVDLFAYLGSPAHP